MRRMVDVSSAAEPGQRTSQLLRGVLDMCLLALISEEPSYGYEMVRKLERRGLALISDGTIYPLLSRLQRRALVETYLTPSMGGPPRKYYRITARGREALGVWTSEWDDFTRSVDSVVEGGSS